MANCSLQQSIKVAQEKSSETERVRRLNAEVRCEADEAYRGVYRQTTRKGHQPRRTYGPEEFAPRQQNAVPREDAATRASETQ
jgi:hypothetical protein